MAATTQTTGILILPPKSMTMRDINELAAKFGCIARQIQPGIIDLSQPLIPKPFKSKMVSNVPEYIASSVNLAPGNNLQ